MILIFALIVLPLLVISFFSYIQQNIGIKVEQKYGNVFEKTPLAGNMSSTTLLLVTFIGAFILMITIMNKLAEKQYMLKQSTSMFWWMMITILIFTISYLITINTDLINKNFIGPYSKSAKEINENINILRNLNCNECTIENGANKGMKISEWMNTMLSRNIKRAHDNNIDPNIILDDKSTNTLYSYIENSLGKELQELPESIEGVDGANDSRKKIRKELRMLRHNNDKMLSPVKSFVTQVTVVSAILIAIISFIIFHIAYMNYPTVTTIFVSIISVMLLVLALGIYTWNAGRNIYA
jgi:hypothetical protein